MALTPLIGTSLPGTSLPGRSEFEHRQKIAYLEAMGWKKLPEWEATPQWHYGTRLNGRRLGVTPSASAAHYMATAQPGSRAPSKFNPLPKKKTPAKPVRKPVRERQAVSMSLPHLRIITA